MQSNDHGPKAGNVSVFVSYSLSLRQCSVIDTFVEITPHEIGYSIPGAFLDTSSYGSQFDQGVKLKDQPEMNMLSMQGEMIYLSLVHLPFICIFLFINTNMCDSGIASLEKLLEELLR